jgi:hypothetical protein
MVEFVIFVVIVIVSIIIINELFVLWVNHAILRTKEYGKMFLEFNNLYVEIEILKKVSDKSNNIIWEECEQEIIEFGDRDFGKMIQIKQGQVFIQEFIGIRTLPAEEQDELSEKSKAGIIVKQITKYQRKGIIHTISELFDKSNEVILQYPHKNIKSVKMVSMFDALGRIYYLALRPMAVL